LPVKVQLASTDEESQSYIPPPLTVAELPEKVTLVRVGEAPSSLYSPPPFMRAELPVKVQLASVGEEPSLNMPPPQSLGKEPSALPPLMVKPSRMAVAFRSVPAGWKKTW